MRQRARDAFDGLEQRHFDLIGLVMVAVGRLFGVRALPRLGRWRRGEVAFLGARVHGRPGRLRRAADGLRPRLGADRQADDPRAAGAQRRRVPGAARAPACVRRGHARPGAGEARAPRLLRAGVLSHARRRDRRVALLGLDVALPAPRRTDPRRADAAVGDPSLDGHDDRESRPERRGGDAPRIGRNRGRRSRRPRQRLPIHASGLGRAGRRGYPDHPGERNGGARERARLGGARGFRRRQTDEPASEGEGAFSYDEANGDEESGPAGRAGRGARRAGRGRCRGAGRADADGEQAHRARHHGL